jgi:large subunit ribosomal protein L9
MDVILLQDVEHVGLKGDVVDVKRGYARNYLLPRRLAEVATPGALSQAQNVRAQRARQEARTADQAQEIAAVLAETVLRFDVKAGPTGSLFGSVTATDIAEELWRTRKVRVDRRKLEMDSIKRIGRYTITAQLFDGVSAEVRAEVVPEGGELPPEEELAAMEAAEAEAAAAEAEARATSEAAIEELLVDEAAEEEELAEAEAEAQDEELAVVEADAEAADERES